MNKRILLPIIVFGVFILGTQCTPYENKKSTQLDIMTFNIWQEGTSVPNGLKKIRDVILSTQPDLVGFTEVRNYEGEDWTKKIIEELKTKGLNYECGNYFSLWPKRSTR